MGVEKKPFKERLLVGEDLEFNGLRTWLASERIKVQAFDSSFVRQPHDANSRPEEKLRDQLEHLIKRAQDEVSGHEKNLKAGKVFREAVRWRRKGYLRLRGLLKIISHINSNLETIVVTQERSLENQRTLEAISLENRRTLEAISQNIQAIGANICYRLEQMRVRTNEEDSFLESSTNQGGLPKSISQLDFNFDKSGIIAGLHSAASVTLSFLSSLGDSAQYKGKGSCEAAAMDLKRWALGFTAGELALDRILDDSDEGRQVLKECIVGALVDIIQMEGSMLEYLSKSGLEGCSQAQGERIQAMNENTKALLKREDVLSAAGDQSVAVLETEDGRENAEDGMDIFASALEFIQKTTTSLFDLVPAIRNLRQEKLLYLQKLKGLDRRKEEPPVEKHKRVEDDKAE